MSSDDILRDALRDDAGRSEPGDHAWSKVRDRAASIRSRRRVMERGTALVAAAAIVAGVVVATDVFGGDEKHSIATPPATGERIAIARLGEDRVEIVSIDDGRVLDVVLEGDGARGVSGIAATPDGTALLVSRASQAEGCPNNAPVPELVRVDLETGVTEQIVPGATHPIVSPDGRWVAYAMQDSCIGGYLGITSLVTGEHFREGDDEPLMPVAWSTTSTELLSRFGDPSQGSYRFITPGPDGDRQPVEGELPFGTTAAAYAVPDDKGFRRFVAAVGDEDGYGYLVAEIAGGGLVERELFSSQNGLPPRQLSVSSTGVVLVVESEGLTLVWSPGDPQAHAIGERALGAAWLPATQAPPDTTTTTSAASVPSVMAPNTLVVATADQQLQVIDVSGTVLRVLHRNAALDYRRVELASDGVTLLYDQFDEPCGDAGGTFALEHAWSTVRIDQDPLAFGHHGGAFSALSPDGQKVAFRLGSCAADAELVVHDLATGDERSFSLEQPQDGGPAADLVGPVGWDADNQHLMLRVNREPFTEFWYVDTATTGQLTGPTFGPKGEQGAEIGPTSFAPLGTTGRWAAAYANVGGPSLVEYDLDTNSVVRPLAELPDFGVEIAGTDATGEHLLLLVSNGSGGFDLYRWSEGDAVTTLVAEDIVAADW